MIGEFNLRNAVNAISDIVDNRPPPLREFDQIYMKVADMVIHCHFVAERFHGKDVVFVGDGDAIGLSVMHLAKLGVFTKGPKSVTLLDFDERITSSWLRFSEKHGFREKVSVKLYNVIDAVPDDLLHKFDAFHINPPWGASNGGTSVFAFLGRGIEATHEGSEGIMVIADDPVLEWTQRVLLDSQRYAATHGYAVSELLPQLHLYHLDDDPDLRSCACLFRAVEKEKAKPTSVVMTKDQLTNFYGKENPLLIRYVRERPHLNRGRASDDTYDYERIDWEA